MEDFVPRFPCHELLGTWASKRRSKGGLVRSIHDLHVALCGSLTCNLQIDLSKRKENRDFGTEDYRN